jgi:CsoR family transcriptional regulator, copper-sensing transcriptional repressor
MEPRSPELKSDLAHRLRRIEGQVRGVQRMVDEDRDCPEILQQMAAIRSATHQASLLLARAYAARCMDEPTVGDRAEVLDTLIATLSKLE